MAGRQYQLAIRFFFLKDPSHEIVQAQHLTLKILDSNDEQMSDLCNQQIQDEVEIEPSLAKLSPMYVPTKMINQFISIAQNNTANFVETLGILLGKEDKNGYLITVLYIPFQTGNGSECQMQEGEILKLGLFQIEHELLTLGWIHTHPQYVEFLKYGIFTFESRLVL